MEAELEAQLEQSETRCSEYQSQVNRLALENDSLKVDTDSLYVCVCVLYSFMLRHVRHYVVLNCCVMMNGVEGSCVVCLVVLV